MINAYSKVVECIEELEKNNEYEVGQIIGRDQIDEYMKQFSRSSSELMYSLHPVDNLDVKTFAKFSVLKASTCDSEVIMIVQNDQVLLKMISINGVSTYKTICDGIVISEKKKDSFMDTDIYFDEKHVISNRVMIDKKGEVTAERYSYSFDDDHFLRNKTIDTVYKNGVPFSMSVKSSNLVLPNDIVSSQLSVDLETISGRIRLIDDLNGRYANLLQQLVSRLQTDKTYMKK